MFEEHQLSFREMDELSNRIANILRGAGLHHGNTAAVFMENCLEYLPVFLAMNKLGVTGGYKLLVFKGLSFLFIKDCSAEGNFFSTLASVPN